MNKIIVIIPYFGKIPDYFTVWKESILKNDTIDFCMFTDNKSIVSAGNLKVHHIAFKEYVDLISSSFDFQIVCDQPYKLCDYKPVYGYVFNEMLKDYEFWGYCDMDMIFGNIRKYITTEILDSFDHIFVTAHFSLYRNRKYINELFLSKGDYPEYNYDEVFKTNDACYFDEFRGMELKCLRTKISIYQNSKLFIDLSPKKSKFYNLSGQQVIFKWDNGELKSIDTNGNSTELLYVHFQKRKMNVQINNKNKYYILPGLMCDENENEKNLFDISSGCAYEIRFTINKIIKSVKKYGIVKNIKRTKRLKEIVKYKDQLLD